VIEKDISLGEAVKEDADIFMIADLSTVWVEVAVYSKDTNLVREGQKVKVRAKALNLEQDGTLTYLGSLVGEQTRTAKGLIVLQNPDRKWRPGTLVNVELLQQEVPVPVAVSTEAIQSYRDWSVVFAQFGNFFEVRPLKLGHKDENWVEVLEGLSAGQKYVSHNSFVLKADLGKSEASHEH
jgi:cobalt-zinc-cadmium efflux system membrane fusion protein